MKTSRLIELRRQAADLRAAARDILAEMNEPASDSRMAELEKEHSRIMRELDINQLDVEEARESSERNSRRPPQGGETRGDSYGDEFHEGGWFDEKGNPVRVLAANEPYAEGRSNGMAFGDLMRALAVGPRNDAEKRALAEGTGSSGGYTVPTPLAAEFIDRLRAKSCAIRAGARTVPMTSASLAIARLESDPAVTWRLENSLIDASDPSFARVLLEAKAVAGIVKVSRELLGDTVNVGEILTNAFAQAMALELDRVALFGDGTDDGPVGIAGTSGINSVTAGGSGGTNGYPITSDGLIDAWYENAVDNAADPTAMIMHPRTLASMAKLKSGDGVPMVYPDLVARIPRLTTTAASITETQGSANNASSVIMGDFTQLFIGMRDEMEVTVLRERYADYGQVGFLAWMRCDVQLAHKASFCRLKGIIP